MSVSQWVYTAYTTTGRSISGTIEADSAESARQLLQEQSLYPERIRENKQLHLAISKNKLSATALNKLTVGLSILLESGSDLKSCLISLLQISKERETKLLLQQVLNEVESGRKLSESLELFPKTFSKGYIAVVKLGESNGSFKDAFHSLAVSLSAQHDLKQKIRAALVYPSLMLVVATGVVFFLLSYILPELTQMLLDLHQELPLSTQLLLSIGSFLQQYSQFVLVFLLVVLIAFSLFWNSTRRPVITDMLLIRLPILKHFYLTYLMYDFSQKMLILLEGRLSFGAALQVVRDASTSARFSKDLEAVIQQLRTGCAIDKSFRKHSLLTYEYQHFIQVGASSGKFQQIFASLTTLYTKKVNEALQTMLSLLEPLLILCMGGIIGFIVISILLPIFQASQAVS